MADEIKQRANALGFGAIGITTPEPMAAAGANLSEYIAQTRHGNMDWLVKNAGHRPNPKAFFPDAQSVITTAYNYYRHGEDVQMPAESGTISIYARGRDYHKIVRKKLKKLLTWIEEQEPRTKGRVFVDSFPIMEKPLAQRAGIGWIAKNSTLIIKGKGSYFFLGGILLNLPLPPDEPFTEEYCGGCNRCRQACPTDAITDPFQLDARRCISYLTIEHKGNIDDALQTRMGNHIFGCDICQVVCPWNQRFATDTSETEFFSRFSNNDLLLSRLASLARAEFEQMFEGTPVRRTGYKNFLRNVEIAAKNVSQSEMNSLIKDKE